MSVNLLTACPHRMNDWRYSHKREQEHKAQYPKSLERKRTVKDFEEKNLISESLLRKGYSWNSSILSVSFLCICLFLINSVSSLTIRELLQSKDGVSSFMVFHLMKLSAKLTKSFGNKESVVDF